MTELKKIAMELTETPRGERQIELLQLIGRELLSNYVIKVSDITIQPLWIEAYYRFNDEVCGFDDSTVHGDERQCEYDILYFHHKTDDQRSGVDICLSPKKGCYLSFLLKYTLVNGAFTTQSQLSKKIPVAARNDVGVLSFDPRPTDMIQFTKRIGITSGNYKDSSLAMVRDVNQRYTDASGKEQSLPQKTQLLKEYIDATYPEEQKSTEAQKAEISRKLVGEYWRDLFK